MFLKFEVKMVSVVTEYGEIEQILGIIMSQQYILKVGFKRFVEKITCSVIRDDPYP